MGSVGRAMWGSAALALIASGCGGGTNAGGERCSAGDRAGWMTHQLRRDQFTIRSLENELALLRAQLRDTPGASSPAPEAPPAPPAQPTADVVASADQAGSQLPPQVADSIYGDVEVVYEGDAARESTVRPRIELHEATRVARGPSSGDEGEASPPPAAIPDVGVERLPVMRGKIPTVEEQLRRARPASGDAALPSRAATSPGPAPVASPAPAAAPVMNVTVSAAPARDAIAEATDEDDIGDDDGIADGTRGQVAAVLVDSMPTAPAPAPAPDPVPAVEPVALPAHPVVDYKRAIAALKRGKHASAVAGLRAFLERFPDHYLADNVQYFLAESYYRRKLYREARGEYRKVVHRYWHGNKLPDAMLKIGLCEIALGKPVAAKAEMGRLVSRFPQTRAAGLARTRIEELEGK